MRKYLSRGAVLLLAPLLAALLSIESRASSQGFESEAYQWANGRVIDTVYVHGNTRVKTFAVVREMQSRQGDRLDPRAVDRDQRYIGDLSPFATVAVHVEPIGTDRCAIHVVVTERPTLLLTLIYPVLDYDINTERLVYGVKWYDRNFRRRLESFSLDAVRDNRDNDNASAAWSSSWIGWKHIGTGGRISYFNRREASSTPTIVEQTLGQANVAVPLTDSRIKFAQLLTGLAYAHNRIGVRNASAEAENLLSPSVGFRYDNRDAGIKPTSGGYFYINTVSNTLLGGAGNTYYRADNDIRYFIPLDRTTVLALRSNATVQMGDYPDYIRFGLGGPGTIRGYERSDFRSAHRWIQTVELRILPWPKLLYRVPLIGITDFQFGLVAFVDTGIGWSQPHEFRYDNFHSGFGAGIRLFSPIQDVLRLDFAYSATGKIRPYFSTGANF
jgi:outer membrane protein assembly factor BamA